MLFRSDKQKDSVSTQLNTAQSELSNGEKELNSQTESFQEQKENALDAADVSNMITMDMIQGILSAQNFSMPAGYITEDNVEYLIRIGDKLETVQELSDLVLFDMGMDDVEPIKLSDVADVFESDNSAEVYAKINGNDGIILTFQKQNNYATAEVAKSLTNRFSEIEISNEGTHFATLMDQGMYIDLVVNSVLKNLIYGGILAVIILLIFLRDIKPTFITACSIPVSVVFALVLMYFSGVTLNVISLSGLAVGIGMLVDNSIVVIENIYRLRSKGYSIVQASVNGAKQVAGAITASTLTTVCVFLPIVFVEGMVRQLFVDMALTILYSLMASLIIALTFVPMMASSIMKKQKEQKHVLQGFAYKIYDVCIRACLKLKAVALLAVIALLVLSVVLALKSGTSYMPDMDSTQVSVNATLNEEAEFADAVVVSDQIMEIAEGMDDVDTVGIMIGNGNVMAGMMGGSGGSGVSISGYIILKDKKSMTSQEFAKQLEEKCQVLEVEEFSASGSTMDMSALGGTGIQVNIMGTETDQLQKIASDVAAIVKNVEGTTEVSDGMDDPTKEIRIHVNKEKAIEKGLMVAQVFQEVKTAITSETTANEITLDQTEYAVILKDENYENVTRNKLENHKFEVTAKDGSTKTIKLKDIVDFEEGLGLSTINRAKQTRYITVSALIDDNHNVGLVGDEVKNALKDFEIPDGYSVEFAGEDESIMEAMVELVKMLLLAVALIYLIMVAQFQSLLSPFIVLDRKSVV